MWAPAFFVVFAMDFDVLLFWPVAFDALLEALSQPSSLARHSKSDIREMRGERLWLRALLASTNPL